LHDWVEEDSFNWCIVIPWLFYLLSVLKSSRGQWESTIMSQEEAATFNEVSTSVFSIPLSFWSIGWEKWEEWEEWPAVELPIDRQRVVPAKDRVCD
jgi:hypothetical protein